MRTWLSKQWDEIKGNAKFWAVMIILGAANTVAGVVTRGLLWWQQALLGLCFSGMFAWASIATWLVTRKHAESPAKATSSSTLPLSQKVFALCRELQEFLDKSGPEPDIDESWHTSDGPIVWAERWRNEVEPWQTRFTGTYWLRFEKRVENTRHEFAELAIKDEELEKAIAEIQKQPRKGCVALARERLAAIAGKVAGSGN